MAQYSINQAKTHLTKLIAAALEGSDIVIARGKVPAVRLVPIAPRGQRRFGALKGKIAINARFDEPLPENELHGWTREPKILILSLSKDRGFCLALSARDPSTGSG